jgi:glycerophosphoryl diester phosphodiesterase
VAYGFSVVGHRGAAAYRLENTLAGYSYALALGCDGIELDVHLSSDGILFCHHDSTLNANYTSIDGHFLNTSNGQERRIAHLPSSQLERCRIGTIRPGSSYLSRRPLLLATPLEPFPKLGNALRFIRDKSDHARVIVEVKLASETPFDSPLITQFARRVLDVVKAENMVARTVVCAFHWAVLAEIRRLSSCLPTWHSSGVIERNVRLLELGRLSGASAGRTAMLRDLYESEYPPWFAGYAPRDYGQSYPAAIAAAGGNGWFSRHDILDQSAVSAAHNRGLNVAAWTVNKKEDIQRMQDISVDAVCSDYPDRLLP